MLNGFFNGDFVIHCHVFDEYKLLVDFINCYNRNKILAKKMKTISPLLKRVWNDHRCRYFWIENKINFIGSTEEAFEDNDMLVMEAKCFFENAFKVAPKIKAIYLGI